MGFRGSRSPGRSWPRISPPLWAVIFLSLAMLLSIGLAIQSTRMASALYDDARRRADDFARYAARELTGRIADQLDYRCLYPAFYALRERGADGPLPEPDALAASGSSQLRRAMTHVAYYFETHDERVTTAPEGHGGDDALARRAASAPSVEGSGYVLLPGGGPERPLVVGPPRGGVRRGFALENDAIATIAREVYERSPLIPPALLRDIETTSLTRAELFTADGESLATLGPAPSASPLAVSSDTLAASLGSVRVDVHLQPEYAVVAVLGLGRGVSAAAMLVQIGLTGLLLLAALWVLRRESQLARLRADFVAAVSHELRTPLAQIRLFAETLRLGRVRSDEEAERSLEIIDQEARRLTHLIDTVIHFSRAERGVLALSREPLRLDEALRDAAAAFRPMASARSMRLVCACDEPVEVTADPDAIRQLVLNLLDNAVKYGPQGQEITLGARANGRTVSLFVEDQGPGIPADERRAVWRRFFRLPRDVSSQVAGSGIGLAVVRDIVERHDGRASIASVEPHGTRVTVELPRDVEGAS